MMVTGNGGTGYIRVDWYTPDGLPTWGDGRLFILGTEGYIELRKYVNVATDMKGGNHLYIVDKKQARYIDCKDVDAAVRPAVRRGHREPHGDRAGPGAGVARRRARAESAEERDEARHLI